MTKLKRGITHRLRRQVRDIGKEGKVLSCLALCIIILLLGLMYHNVEDILPKVSNAVLHETHYVVNN